MLSTAPLHGDASDGSVRMHDHCCPPARTKSTKWLRAADKEDEHLWSSVASVLHKRGLAGDGLGKPKALETGDAGVDSAERRVLPGESRGCNSWNLTRCLKAGGRVDSALRPAGSGKARDFALFAVAASVPSRGQEHLCARGANANGRVIPPSVVPLAPQTSHFTHHARSEITSELANRIGKGLARETIAPGMTLLALPSLAVSGSASRPGIPPAFTLDVSTRYRGPSPNTFIGGSLQTAHRGDGPSTRRRTSILPSMPIPVRLWPACQCLDHADDFLVVHRSQQAVHEYKARNENAGVLRLPART